MRFYAILSILSLLGITLVFSSPIPLPNTNRCDKVCPGTTIGAFAGTFGLGVIASGGYYLRKKNLAKAPQRQYLKGLEEALESAGHHL
ncbi:hypothetical protein FRB95_014406 [Tulasnella sp. JGI-2019a]|nr:hypothetical protein FRB93_002641 [Tulasnella sp. JGI-2019a]KAG9038857.1 hypothetical protein FRB95_014406 [Tulasnella sp. JGI-2019a]